MILVECPKCPSVHGWCGETDYPLGVFEGTRLTSAKGQQWGDEKGWARESCLVCGGSSEEMGYASGASLKGLGFESAHVLLMAADGVTMTPNPELG